MYVNRHWYHPYLFPLSPFLFQKEATLFLGVSVAENAKGGNFSYTVSLFEKKCLPEPELWLYQSLVPLSVVLVLLVVLILLSSQMVQLRVVLSEQFFPDVAKKRAAYLHEKILRKRCKTKAEKHGDLKTLAIQVGRKYSLNIFNLTTSVSKSIFFIMFKTE